MRRPLVTVLLLLSFALRAVPVSAAPLDAPLDASAYSVRVLDLTNVERQKAGLAPLVMNAQLSTAAESYSKVLASSGCFDHTCGSVPNFADRATQAGYTGWNSLGENIAAGYATPEDVVSGWMQSPGHRANMLSSKFTEIGVGVVSGSGSYGTYWTQEFGSRPGAPTTAATSPAQAVESAQAADDTDTTPNTNTDTDTDTD